MPHPVSDTDSASDSDSVLDSGPVFLPQLKNIGHLVCGDNSWDRAYVAFLSKSGFAIYRARDDKLFDRAMMPDFDVDSVLAAVTDINRFGEVLRLQDFYRFTPPDDDGLYEDEMEELSKGILSDTFISFLGLTFLSTHPPDLRMAVGVKHRSLVEPIARKFAVRARNEKFINCLIMAAELHFERMIEGHLKEEEEKKRRKELIEEPQSAVEEDDKRKFSGLLGTPKKAEEEEEEAKKKKKRKFIEKPQLSEDEEVEKQLGENKKKKNKKRKFNELGTPEKAVEEEAKKKKKQLKFIEKPQLSEEEEVEKQVGEKKKKKKKMKKVKKLKKLKKLKLLCYWNLGFLIRPLMLSRKILSAACVVCAGI